MEKQTKDLTLEELIAKIVEWGREKGLHDTDDCGRQIEKLESEFDELLDGYKDDNPDDIEDACGDMTVVLIQIMAIQKLDFKEVLSKVYDTISKRKGKTVNGIFVKDE